MDRKRLAHHVTTLAMFAIGISTAHAGPIGAINSIFQLITWIIGIVLLATVLALYLCKFIANRRLRALIRLLIVVLAFTPIKLGESLTPAVFSVIVTIFNAPRYPSAGALSHPYFLSYAIALCLTMPILMFVMRTKKNGPPDDRQEATS
jgi:hypothetical protein